MPELPEVETVRRGLAAVMAGRRLAAVEQRRADLRFPMPADLGARLAGRRVGALDRRGKYLLIGLDGDETLILHLGMSGRLLIRDQGVPPTAHDHVVFRIADGPAVAFNDARRFGSLDLTATAALGAHRSLRALGPEPFDPAFDGPALVARLAGRVTPLKAALLDQRTVAGLGNIYVCEALFRARLSPRRLAATVTGARAERLVAAIRSVLGDAIAAGGSSLRDYVQADGELGYFQHVFAVYDREGQPCPACGGAARRHQGEPASERPRTAAGRPLSASSRAGINAARAGRTAARGETAPAAPGIRRLVQSGRSTFYCPRCQR